MNEIDLSLPVLVVDDDTMVLEVIVNYLKEFGFENIIEAKHANHALQLINDPKFRVALVLSDWEMPEVNGLTLLQAIRKNPRRKDLRFIMVTSQRSMERFKISQAARWNVNSYVVKPFRAELLKAKIWHVMGWENEEADENGKAS